MKKSLLVSLFALLVVSLAVSGAMAQKLGFNGIGGRLSYVDAEGVDGTIGFGAHANLGNIIENLTLYPSIEYWTKGEGVVDFSSFSINGDARYYIPTSGSVNVFAGGGLALLFNKVSVGTFDDSETKLGLDLLGGIDIPVSDNLSATAKIKFVVSSDNILKITGGLTYILKK